MNIDKDKTVFLLGGYDLEMVTIRDILLKAGCLVEDKHLSWGAKLSEYRDEIANHHDKTIYAVELEIDDEELGEGVEIVNHHNEYSCNDASLLQVLNMLNMTKTREQELIAANDSGYIPAMKSLDASFDEIREIRNKDKIAQGITDADEDAGKSDAREAEDIKCIKVVQATTNRFATITDELYFQYGYTGKIIIYDDSEITFYGFNAAQLLDILSEKKINRKKCYYGGGDSGYLGFGQQATQNSIVDMKNFVIDKYEEKKTPISTHTFMFPFRFDYMDGNKNYKREYEFYKDKNIEKRIQLGKILPRLNTKLDEGIWDYIPFELNKIVGSEQSEAKYYNEFAYFYDYAREALYNLRPFADSKSFFSDELSYYFEHKEFSKKDSKFIVDTGSKVYELDIDGVSLRIFDTGVAILAIELFNYEHNCFSDIKAINEFSRRIYSQYISTDRGMICNAHFLPKSVTILHSTKGDKYWDRETWDTKNILADNQDSNSEIRIASYLMKMLGEDIFTQKINEKGKFYIQPIVDDRMFVLSSYRNSDVSSSLIQENNYTHSNDWYEYVFVDTQGGTSVKNEWMKYDLLTNATYDRWSGDGVLFGITRYSFVSLTKDDGSWLATHTNTMYFQMMLLLLATRASILRFSDEVAAIVTLESTAEAKRLPFLYEKYLNFYNKLYFKEVTHQDQGIELYDMALKQMKIPEHIAKLDGKFTKLHDFVQMKANNEESGKMNRLTTIGSLFVIPSLVGGLVQLDALKDFGLSAMLWSIPLGIAIAFIATTSWLKKSFCRWFWAILLIIGFLGGVYMSNDWVESQVKNYTSQQNINQNKGGKNE